MIQGLVSVITPTYNCGAFIGATIESVQRQTYTDWEMIIVDDGSVDNTEELVRRYSDMDPRIRYFALEKNSGTAAARTKAMTYAEGEYMAFLDSDDLWEPQKLEQQLRFMKEQACSFSATSYCLIDESGTQKSRIFHVPARVDYNRMLLDCPVGNSTVMYHVEKLGKFTVPDIRKRNDDALWLKMLKKERYILGLDEVLTKYRVRSDSVSSNKFTLIRYHWKLYREIEHLNVFRSAFHIAVWCFIKVFHIK